MYFNSKITNNVFVVSSLDIHDFIFLLPCTLLVALEARRDLVDMGPPSLNLRDFDPRVDLGTPLSIGCMLQKCDKLALRK